LLRTLFRIGPVEVHSYGTLLMVGFVAAILVSVREARRRGLSPELPLDLGVWVLVAGVVFARGMYVALNWDYFGPRPAESLYLWREGGLSFHGGLLGGVVAGAVFAWRRRTSFWVLADMCAPGIALAYGVARFGCLLNGCCYGSPTDLPWGIRFPMYPDSEIMTDPSHPTQVYAAIGSFAILGLLLWARPRLKAEGQLFLLYLVLYSVMRSGVEVLRKGGDTAQVLVGGLTQAQVASAAIFVGAIIGLIWLGRAGRSRRRAAKNNAGQ
jgi:phosphatidylglycerol:prolipoprotein diacylglycerol transferase